MRRNPGSCPDEGCAVVVLRRLGNRRPVLFLAVLALALVVNERLWRDVAGWTNGWAPFWSTVQCGYSGDHGVLEVADDWRTCCAWCAISTRMFMKGNFKKLDNWLTY